MIAPNTTLPSASFAFVVFVRMAFTIIPMIFVSQSGAVAAVGVG